MRRYFPGEGEAGDGSNGGEGDGCEGHLIQKKHRVQKHRGMRKPPPLRTCRKLGMAEVTTYG